MIADRYVIITPVRDEEQFLASTIQSVVAQTLRPAEWVLVNDGSRDRTPEILAQQTAGHDWIQVVHRPDRGSRLAGVGVMEAFYAGYEQLRRTDWDFVVKLDADLVLDPEYFENCLRRFAQDPTLGIGGGVILNPVAGQLKLEHHPRFHVRGATKIYRRACWEQIGGLKKVKGWDTLDEVKATMLGWRTESFPDLTLIQQRFTGDAAGQWSNWVKNGRASYIAGYHPLYLVGRAAARSVTRPWLVASFGLLAGYFGAWLTRAPQIDDPPLIRYLRHQQLRRIFGLSSTWR